MPCLGPPPQPITSLHHIVAGKKVSAFLIDEHGVPCRVPRRPNDLDVIIAAQVEDVAVRNSDKLVILILRQILSCQTASQMLLPSCQKVSHAPGLTLVLMFSTSYSWQYTVSYKTFPNDMIAVPDAC